MAQLLNQALGSPMLIQEEEVKEYSGLINGENKNECTTSIQQRIDNSTINVHVKMLAVFECSERLKRGGHQ